MASRPRNRSFCQPSLRNDRTSRLSGRFFNTIQAYRRVLLHPFISPLFIPLIHPNLVHPRKRLMIRGQKPFGTFGIRNIGGMHQHAQQEPIRVNPALPFAPVDPFFIVAAFSACCGRCDGLGVQDADRWLRIAIQRVSRQFPQRIIDGDEGSITTPCVERGANRTHWRNIRRKQAPLAAGAMFGAQRVDDRAAINVGRAAAVGRRGGDQRHESSPWFIGQIGRILCWRGSQCTVWHYQLPLIRTAWLPS